MCTAIETVKSFILLLTSICLQEDAQAIRKPFKAVDRCPFNESEWKERAVHITCKRPNSYHCLLTESGVSMREQCTKTSLFTSGFCPIFTNEGYLQWSQCSYTACPNSSYRSDEVYKYQICFRNTDLLKESSERRFKDSGSGAGVIPVVVITPIIVVLGLVLILYRRFGLQDRMRLCMTDQENAGTSGQEYPLLQNGENLNSDYAVIEGIVITESIKTALQILESRNVVILRGAIGCGKTYALKAIQNHYKGTDWETVFVDIQNTEVEISKEKQTILLCDNLFGSFGSSVFLQEDVNKTEKLLEEIESANGKTKVIVGIHSHVYDEVNERLELTLLQQMNITVEMDKLSDAEKKLIFTEQLKLGHCKGNSNCWFKTLIFQTVLDKLSKNQCHIGGPFLSLMYCNNHDLFSDEDFSVDPVQTMVKRFQKLSKDSPLLYAKLIYLMCVQEHNCEEDLEPWASDISADLTLDALILDPCRYIQVVEKKVTLAHELLAVFLFKSIAETDDLKELFLHIIQHCKDDIIIQLLRPECKKKYDIFCEFLDVSKSPSNRQVGKVCIWRLARKYKTLEASHPLMTIEFVREKYPKYLKQDPVLHTWSNYYNTVSSPAVRYVSSILGYETDP